MAYGPLDLGNEFVGFKMPHFTGHNALTYHIVAGGLATFVLNPHQDIKISKTNL